MAQVMLEVPAVLSDCTDGQVRLPIEAPTVADAFAFMRRQWPTLGTHVFDEAGNVRPHVLVLHNGRATRWGMDLSAPLSSGDSLQVIQAVSGG